MYNQTDLEAYLHRVKSHIEEVEVRADEYRYKPAERQEWLYLLNDLTRKVTELEAELKNRASNDTHNN